MKNLFALGGIIFLAITGLAADSTDFVTNSLPIQNHGILQIKTPKGWSFEIKGAVNLKGPRAAEMHSEDGAIAVLITAFWDGFGPNNFKPTQKDFETMIEKVGTEQYLPGSVEKKVELEVLKGAAVSGAFARFTDKDWVGKKPRTGQFANVATGGVRCGDLWGNFTVLTNEKDGATFKKALAVVETLEKAKP
jgi:hypothetical protein